VAAAVSAIDERPQIQALDRIEVVRPSADQPPTGERLRASP